MNVYTYSSAHGPVIVVRGAQDTIDAPERGAIYYGEASSESNHGCIGWFGGEGDRWTSFEAAQEELQLTIPGGDK